MKLNYNIVDIEGLKPFISELRSIEAAIKYPIQNGVESFIIDHGPQYTPFFSQQGYKTRFLIIMNKKTVIGSIAGIWKTVLINQKPYTGLYVADLKLRQEFRTQGIIKNCLWYLFFKWPLNQDFQGWDFLYFCAMQRLGSGVDSTFIGAHLGKLARLDTEFNIYMLNAELLYGKDITCLKQDYKNHINLSPKRKEDVLWNDGIKNIISTNTHTLLKLGHLNPGLLQSGNNIRLKKALKVIMKRKNGLVCFAVDSRDQFKINWLKSNGIETETRCKIFSFAPFSPPIRKSDVLFISTGEI